VRTMACTYGLLETVTNNVSYRITGAERKHKVLYAAVLPLLLSISYFGKFSRPKWGAGILATASKSAPGKAHAGRGTL